MSGNKVITFGCRLNSFESEQIKQIIEESSEKNLIVFNSCAVTANAEKDLLREIKKTKKKFPESKIIVTGCASQIHPEKYAKMTQVDLVIGNNFKTDRKYYNLDKNNIKIENYKNNINLDKKVLHSDKIFFDSKKIENNFLNETEEQKIKVNDIMSVKDTAPHLASYFENQTRAFLEIQNGCNHRCTFCIIPYGRGNSRSVPFGQIVEQAKKMVDNGHNEIVFTGVDISGYGQDFDVKLSLSSMIKRFLNLVPNLQRLRLSSIDVAEIDDGFYDLLKDEPRFMPYFHLSIQSGDDIILKRMARRHSRQQILDFCEKALAIRPDITFGADIIAGFPTEDDKMFENSLSIINEANIVFAHIFPYSAREGTPAAKMPQLSRKIIKERAEKLREAAKNQLDSYLKKQVGKSFKVMIEGDGVGKAENFLDVKFTANPNLNLTKDCDFNKNSNFKSNLEFDLSAKNNATYNKGDIITCKITDYEDKYLISN